MQIVEGALGGQAQEALAFSRISSELCAATARALEGVCLPAGPPTEGDSMAGRPWLPSVHSPTCSPACRGPRLQRPGGKRVREWLEGDRENGTNRQLRLRGFRDGPDVPVHTTPGHVCLLRG